jgi:exopolysaccharide biosynthesis operon protein EpsL
MVRRKDRGASGRGRRAAGLRLRGMGAAIIVAGAFVPVTDAAALWDDRLELFVAESVTRDDNVFRISSARDLASVLGSSSKGDTYRTTSFGFNFDVPAGRQRFTGGLAWNDTRYNQFDFLDLTGHAGRAVWLWQVGDDLSGKLGYTETLALASLANVQSGGVQSVVPNALTTQQAFLNAGYRLTPRWELRGEVSELKQSNELPARQVNDIVINGSELTVSYVTPAKNKLGFSARVDDARYPTPQIAQEIVIDNAYRQQIIAVVTDWTPTGRSHFIARAGRVSRSYEQLPQRDFEGPTFNVTYDWNPTGNFMLTTLAVREISTNEEVNVGFVLIKGAALRPTLRLTEKIRMSGTFEYSEREYRGDLTQVAGTPPRIDHVRGAGATASYRPVRQVTLEMAYRRESRASSVAFGDYVTNIASVTARIGF